MVIIVSLNSRLLLTKVVGPMNLTTKLVGPLAAPRIIPGGSKSALHPTQVLTHISKSRWTNSFKIISISLTTWTLCRCNKTKLIATEWTFKWWRVKKILKAMNIFHNSRCSRSKLSSNKMLIFPHLKSTSKGLIHSFRASSNFLTREPSKANNWDRGKTTGMYNSSRTICQLSNLKGLITRMLASKTPTSLSVESACVNLRMTKKWGSFSVFITIIRSA